MRKESKVFVQSVNRIFDIIELLSKEKNGLRLTDLSKILELKSTTIHNLLGTVIHRGYITQDTETMRYRLGYRCLLLAEKFTENDLLLSAASDHLTALNKQTDELVFLGIIQKRDLICALKIESNRPLAVNPDQQWKNQFHSTASGKILLAGLPPREAEAIMEKHGIIRFTARTITRRDLLFEELQKVRQNLYAEARDESVEGISSLAVPIPGPAKPVLAALAVALPSIRFTDERKEELLHLLHDTAEKISMQLCAAGKNISSGNSVNP